MLHFLLPQSDLRSFIGNFWEKIPLREKLRLQKKKKGRDFFKSVTHICLFRIYFALVYQGKSFVVNS